MRDCNMQVCNALEKLNFTFTSIKYNLPKPESRSVAAPLDCFGTTALLFYGTFGTKWQHVGQTNSTT